MFILKATTNKGVVGAVFENSILFYRARVSWEMGVGKCQFAPSAPRRGAR